MRLAALEGAPRVRVEASLQGAVALSRVEGSALVRRDDGATAPAFALEPRPGSELLVGGRPYPGRLRVEARPEGGLRVANLVALEPYVERVVSSELALWSAPPALLEAQAIAARTYALYTLQSRQAQAPPGGDVFLWDSVEDQAYRGSQRLVELPRNIADKLAGALARTRGIALLWEDRFLETLYHAACGGRTAAIEAVFPREARRPLRPVPCPGCAELAASGADEMTWSWTASRAELTALAARLGLGDALVSLRPTRVDADGRWLEVELVGTREQRRISVRDLRAHLGAGLLKSGRIARTWPRPGQPLSSGLRFDGIGRGHGVGLCQTGALDLAEGGATARQILRHYYPDAHLAPWLSVVTGARAVDAGLGSAR